MSENGTSAGAGEGAAAPGAASEGNPAQAETGAPEAEPNNGDDPAGGGGGNEDDELKSLGLDPNDKRGLKTRFTTLSEQQRAAEKAAREAAEQAAYWRGKAEERAAASRPAEQSQTDANAPPDPKDKAKYPLGVDDPQYIEDRAVYRIRQETAATAAQEAQRQKAQADFAARRDRFIAARDKAAANADTPNAAKQLGELPVQFTDEIVLSEHAALIAEHFATTGKGELDKLLKEHIRFDDKGGSHWRTPASATQFARKLGALESSLPGVFAARKQTKAGTPPGTVLTGGGAGGQKQPKDMDVDELDAWIKQRKKASGE